MKVEDVMTYEVRTCRENYSANDAARIMWENDCGSVPVTDADGRVVGINVSKLLDGEQLGFLVPARYAAALLERARKALGSRELSGRGISSVLGPELAQGRPRVVAVDDDANALTQVKREMGIDAIRSFAPGFTSIAEPARCPSTSGSSVAVTLRGSSTTQACWTRSSFRSDP